MKQFSSFYSFLSFLAIGLFLMGCGNDSNNGPKPASFDDFEYAANLRATITNNGQTTQTEGLITIDDKGAASIEMVQGSFSGTALKTGNSYMVTITNASGGFADVTNMSASIDTASGATNIAGTNPDGTNLTVSGQANPIVMTDGGWDKLLKSSVSFSHSEDMLASITIDGTTFSGINAHYHKGGLCDSYYALLHTMPGNFDSLTSQIHCYSGTLKGLDGQPVNFTDCSSAQFILDKNKKYSYTINWDNGTTTTGEFTSPSGGRRLFICPKPSGGGGGTPTGNNTFTIGNSTSKPDEDGVLCGAMDGMYMMEVYGTNDNDIEVILGSQPTSNKTYTVVNGEDSQTLSANQAAILAYNDATNIEYVSSGGGQVTATVSGGKIKLTFSNIPAKEEWGTATTTVSGNLTCD